MITVLIPVRPIPSVDSDSDPIDTGRYVNVGQQNRSTEIQDDEFTAAGMQPFHDQYKRRMDGQQMLPTMTSRV